MIAAGVGREPADESRIMVADKVKFRKTGQGLSNLRGLGCAKNGAGLWGESGPVVMWMKEPPGTETGG
jgi:hypothetical protein